MKKEDKKIKEEAIEKEASSATADGNENEALEQEVEVMVDGDENKADEYLGLLQRLQADFDNYRRRVNLEREEWLKYSSMRFAVSLLPILDNFERALSSASEDASTLKDGIELIHRQLADVLTKEGVNQMEVVGAEFNPNFHEAVMQGPNEEFADNVVCQELQKGYMFLDRVMRPAMVKVTKN